MFTCEEYIQIRVKWFGETRNLARVNYTMYKKALKKKMKTEAKDRAVCVSEGYYNVVVDSGPTPSPTQAYAVTTFPLTTSSFATTGLGLNWTYPINKEEGNIPMNYATATVQAATTETQDQRKYLERRLQDVYSQKRDGLEAAFGLVDDEAPNGPGELSERLKEGKFTIRGLDKDKGATQFNYWCWFDLIQWRDPSRKEDAEGFKKAVDELKALRQKSLDSIKIEDVKAGLDAVKALEAWTPTGAAN